MRHKAFKDFDGLREAVDLYEWAWSLRTNPIGPDGESIRDVINANITRGAERLTPIERLAWQLAEEGVGPKKALALLLSQPTGNSPSIKPKAQAEYDRECVAFLKAECAAGRTPGPRAVQACLHCGMATVYRLPSFRAYWSEHKKGRKPKAVTLTEGMRSVSTKDDGRLAHLIRDQHKDMRTNRVHSRERL